MPLMACSPNLRTHFRHLSDFALVVVLLVFVWYLSLNTATGVVSAGVVVVVAVVALVVVCVVGTVVGDGDDGSGGGRGDVILVFVVVALFAHW